MAKSSPAGNRAEPALELGRAIDRALDEFAEETESLIRVACGIPDEYERVRTPVVFAFLAHCLALVHTAQGRAGVDGLVKQLLDGFDEAAGVALRSGEQERSPGGEGLSS